MTLYIYPNTPLESQSQILLQISPFAFQHHYFPATSLKRKCIQLRDMFLKFSLPASGIGRFPFSGLVTPVFDADGRWQHQSWQILAAIVGELSGTNSLISPHPVVSWLETRKGGKVRESGKMEQDLCPLLSGPGRAPQPQLGSHSGKRDPPHLFSSVLNGRKTVEYLRSVAGCCNIEQWVVEHRNERK